MLGFADVLILWFLGVISLLRFGYIVLCIIVGIGVVFGFFVKAVRKVFKIKTFEEEFFDKIKKGDYKSKTSEKDDISSDFFSLQAVKDEMTILLL